MEKGYFVMDNARATRPRHNEYVPSDAMNCKMAKTLSDPFDQPAYTNDYLTPTTETHNAHAQPPEVPAFPAGGFRLSPQSSVTSRDRDSVEPRQVPRADSGIEADFRRGMSTTSSEYPRSSTIYECIDSNPHYIDPSPHTCYPPGSHSAGGETTSSGVSSSSPVTVPRSTPCRQTTVASDSEDGGLDDDVRRCLHPEYTSLSQSNPQLYAPACLCASSKGSPSGAGTEGSSRSARRHLRYLWCGLALLTIITVFLLAVLAYIFVVVVPGMQAHIRTQEDDIKRMGMDYQNMSQKVDALLWLSTANQTMPKPDTSVAKAVADKIATLNDSVREFGSQLQELSVDLQVQMNNISRQPDLKGVQGVGSLDSCSYYSTTTTQALPGPASTTSWLPETGSVMMRDKMVMSVTCAVEGGTMQQVESQVLSPSAVQYRCRCDGKMVGHDRRRCQVHLVLCPRLLSVDLLPPN